MSLRLSRANASQKTVASEGHLSGRILGIHLSVIAKPQTVLALLTAVRPMMTMNGRLDRFVRRVIGFHSNRGFHKDRVGMVVSPASGIRVHTHPEQQSCAK